MAIDLAKLVVSMEANTAKFQKDMERVDRRLNGLSKSATAAGRAFGAALGSLATLGIGQAARSVSKFADSVGDSAKVAGLSNVAYQELRYAASQLDVEYGQLDTALIKFNDTLGDARRGGKEAAKVFADLGLDPAQFKNTDEAFTAVTKKLGQIEDGFVRASLQSALFGRAAGPKMAEFLSTSSGEVARLREEAHLLGVVMTDETIKAADQTEKKFAALSSFIKTNLAASFAQLAPLIAKATEELFKFINAPKPFSEEEKEAQRNELNRLTRLRAAAERGHLGGDLLEVETGFRDQDKALAALSQRIRGQMELMNATRAGPKPTAITGGAARKDEKPAAVAATREQIKLQSDHEKQLERVREEVLLLNDAEGEEARMRAIVNELYAQGKIPRDAYLAYLEGASERLTVLGDEAERAEEKTSVFADQAARNIQSFTASMVDAAMAGENMGDAIVASLRRIAAELFTTMALQGLGDIFTGMGFPNLGKAIAGKRADGGPVAGGKSYIVGEEGPELFTPKVSGSIIPNGDFGGGKVEVKVDARGADPASAANILRAMSGLEMRIYENLRRETAPA